MGTRPPTPAMLRVLERLGAHDTLMIDEFGGCYTTGLRRVHASTAKGLRTRGLIARWEWGLSSWYQITDKGRAALSAAKEEA